MSVPLAEEYAAESVVATSTGGGDGVGRCAVHNNIIYRRKKPNVAPRAHSQTSNRGFAATPLRLAEDTFLHIEK